MEDMYGKNIGFLRCIIMESRGVFGYRFQITFQFLNNILRISMNFFTSHIFS